MASTSSHLEQGYEKIFRWCSYEFRQIGRDMQIEVGKTMREAIRRLRKRPELLSCIPFTCYVSPQLMCAPVMLSPPFRKPARPH
jgi:hypothetical protein